LRKYTNGFDAKLIVISNYSEFGVATRSKVIKKIDEGRICLFVDEFKHGNIAEEVIEELEQASVASVESAQRYDPILDAPGSVTKNMILAILHAH
jgi:hypothetical protein